MGTDWTSCKHRGTESTEFSWIDCLCDLRASVFENGEPEMNEQSNSKASPALMIGILVVVVTGIVAIELLSGLYYTAALVAIYVFVMTGVVRDCPRLAQTDGHKQSLRIIAFWLVMTVLGLAGQLKPMFVSADRDDQRLFVAQFGMCLALLTALKLVKTMLATLHTPNDSESTPDGV